MENKLYKVHACGRFKKGDAHECIVAACDEAMARQYARIMREELEDKVLFVEEIDISGYVPLFLCSSEAVCDYIKLPADEERADFTMSYKVIGCDNDDLPFC